MNEKLQNEVIKKYGFESPYTIFFCSCIESFEQVIKNEELRNKVIQELFDSIMKAE